MIVNKVRGAVGAAPGLVLMAAVAVLAAACSHGGNSAASSSNAAGPGGSQLAGASPSAAGAAPAGASTPAASAVAVSGVVPPSASNPARFPVSSPVAGSTACTAFAAAHTFLRVVSATPDADGSLTVTGNNATIVCGGPDDYHYDVAAAAVTGRVLSGAALRVLSSGAQLRPLTLPKFPAYLTTDKNTRVFMFTGALAGITALSEQYHP